MKLLLPIVFLVTINANAQPALIKDPDGFSNVRSGPGTDAVIQDTLSSDRVVFVYKEDSNSDWMPVDYNKGSDQRSGFVHSSRLVFLSGLPALKKSSGGDTSLQLENDRIKITVRQQDFRSKGRKLNYESDADGSKFLRSIDGRIPWGTDGQLPHREYRSISVTWNNQPVSLPRSAFSDLFDPNFGLTTACYRKTDDTVFLEATNSDGAGGYVVIWVIRRGRLIQRETFVPF